MIDDKKTIDLRHLIKRCPECGEQYSQDSVFCGFDGQTLRAARWNPSSDTLLGTTVDGRYEVIAILGEGGMGTVYKVQHAALQRNFAMKVLRKDLARDQKLCARFMQEAKATAAIKHPHVVAISDFGRVPDGRPYFVMEVLEGPTLSQVVRAESPFNPARAARIGARVARAIGAAHEAGVVHRDLKPENIFLVGGVDDDVRVVDFGAALVVGGRRLTKTGVVFGTPHFMSPEQASGQPVDHRADIYALGVILYEMCTGRVPFEADTFMGVLTKHVYTAPERPSALLEDRKALGALEQIILKTLEKRPERRYVTMEALARDIDRIVRQRADGGWEIAASLSKAPPAPESGSVRAGEVGTYALPLVGPTAKWRAWAAVAAVLGGLAVVISLAVAPRGGRGDASATPGGASTPAMAVAGRTGATGPTSAPPAGGGEALSAEPPTPAPAANSFASPPPATAVSARSALAPPRPRAGAGTPHGAAARSTAGGGTAAREPPRATTGAPTAPASSLPKTDDVLSDPWK